MKPGFTLIATIGAGVTSKSHFKFKDRSCVNLSSVEVNIQKCSVEIVFIVQLQGFHTE